MENSKRVFIRIIKNSYNYLIKYLNDLSPPTTHYFESTGIYSRGMERFCCVNQINYIQMNPLEAKFKTAL